MGDVEEGLRLAARASELAPGDQLARVARSNNALWAGDFELAFALNVEILEANPADGFARVSQGLLKLRLNDRSNAEPDLRLGEMLLSTTPAGVIFYSALAAGYYELGLDADAQRMFDRYVRERDPEAIGAGDWFQLYLAVGDLDSAYDWLEVALDRVENGEIDLGFIALASQLSATSGPRLDDPRFREAFDRILDIAMRR